MPAISLSCWARKAAAGSSSAAPLSDEEKKPKSSAMLAPPDRARGGAAVTAAASGGAEPSRAGPGPDRATGGGAKPRGRGRASLQLRGHSPSQRAPGSPGPAPPHTAGGIATLGRRNLPWLHRAGGLPVAARPPAASRPAPSSSSLLPSPRSSTRSAQSPHGSRPQQPRLGQLLPRAPRRPTCSARTGIYWGGRGAVRAAQDPRPTESPGWGGSHTGTTCSEVGSGLRARPAISVPSSGTSASGPATPAGERAFPDAPECGSGISGWRSAVSGWPREAAVSDASGQSDKRGASAPLPRRRQGGSAGGVLRQFRRVTERRVRGSSKMAAPEERELTAEQTEKLLQFQDLTGIDSMDQCRHTLEQHNWNIEAAVQDRLNEQEGVPSVFNPPPSRPLQGLLGWGYYLIMLPFRFTYYTLLDIFRFALRFVRPDPRSRVTDPVGDIVSFIHMFEEKYGRIHPVFYQGTYSQALNDAKRELRFLLVYLHGDDHQDSDEFCRNTLCAPEVITLINTRMLFWACSTNKPEGYRVSQALRENTYPFLAMIMLKDRRMTVVGRLEGLIRPDDLINQLTFIMDANQTYLVSERLEREERNQTQVLRQQQDEAYLASLRADQEKERKKKEERERKKRKEEEVQQQKLAEERRRQTLQEEKVRRLERLPPEPHPDDPESVKIIFKLPNDSRVERRFHFTQSLTVIHDFLFSLKESPEKFQIEANFPRRVLPCLPTEERPTPPTLQEAGLSHTEVLFVQDLTDD
ncbi:FAS-associated factor 2 isoform X2 [Carettochelys insculpta]|uniref:FAS-associated factor 2 isoform X2 n=1 Tax=Carettochelys insculpta TaxID=44489 RepID=UPI003EBE61DC